MIKRSRQTIATKSERYKLRMKAYELLRQGKQPIECIHLLQREPPGTWFAARWAVNYVANSLRKVCS